MFENRNLRLDLAALALLALVVFLAISLATYSPADPLPHLVAPLHLVVDHDPLVHPPNETVQNACGRWGALAAELLLTWFGLGAYYFVFSLAAVDITLLARRGIDMPVLRGVGWIASLVGLTTIVAMVLPGASAGPVIGPGGYLGALGRAIVEMHFATVGGLILMSSVT